MIAIISKVAWMTAVKIKIFILLVLTLLNYKLISVIILTILSGLLRQICDALRLFLQSLFSLIKLIKLVLLMSSLILNLLLYPIRI